MRLTQTIFAFTVLIVSPLVSQATTVTTYTTDPAFLAAVGATVTDNYTAFGYSTLGKPAGSQRILTNAEMDSVLNETQYVSTAFANLDIVGPNSYCAGCNGSFSLGFTSTTVGTTHGVYGVGLNYIYNQGDVAFVTFGDGTTANYTLVGNSGFLGITSSADITSIALGGTNGAVNYNDVGLSSLTIAAPVPLPAAAWLMLSGLGGLGAMTRRRRAV